MSLVLAACASGEVTLLVEVKTDLVPGVEFTDVHARVATVHDGRRPVGLETRRADRADDARYEGGVRVAELGLAPGTFVVEVGLVDASGQTIASREVHVEVRSTTVLRIAIARSCLEADCPAPGGDPAATECLGRRCVPPLCSSGEEPGCERECDADGDCPTPAAACARAACVDGACFAASDGASCPTGSYCDPTRGCAGEVATSDAGMPEPLDAAVECGDCDDGDPCTDDACSGGTCVHANNTASCDDGVFCNGADRCGGGTCAHAGDPCAASTTCSEDDDACLGCATGADCPAPSETAWSTCGYPSTCGEVGTQSRTVTTWACSAGACTSDTRAESRACTRDTDGTAGCSPTAYGSYGACGSFGDECDESGLKWRTVTRYACQSGACSPAATSESAPCPRSTDGSACGTPSVGSWGSCDYDSACDESGRQSRTITTYACSAGSCGVPAVTTETRACTRDTDGSTCGSGLLECQAASCVAGSCQLRSTCGAGQHCCEEGCRPNDVGCR